MAGILDLLNSDLGKQIVSGIADSTGTDTSKTSSVLTMGLPVLMKAMEQNTSTSKGAEGLMGALASKHDGSILDNLSGLFGGGVDESVKQDGAGILSHILGTKQSGVEELIGQKAGIDASTVSNILKVAAPLIMGYLGKEKQSEGLSNSRDLTGLLGGLLDGSSNANNQGFLEKVLDADGDGSMIDDVAGMFLGEQKDNSNDGIGGMLGGLFGK